MENIINNGVEGNIEYTLIGKGDDIEILVKNNKTEVGERRIYNCMYRPIFGYDCSDVDEVNKILDKMIERLK